MITGKTPYKRLEPPGGPTTLDKPGKSPPILCKVHHTRIEGLNYLCRKCGSVFCLSCITNVLLPEGKCMVCNADLEISDEYRHPIDRNDDGRITELVLSDQEQEFLINF